MSDIFSNVILPAAIITIIILMIWSKITKKPIKELVKPIIEMLKGGENE